MPKHILSRLPMPRWTRHRFTLMGLNLERFLNTLQKEEITLLRAARTDRRSLDCVCRSADLERIAAIAAEKGWRLENVAPLGAGARLRQLLRRPGLIAGALLTFALLAAAMQFVWLVRIEGAGAYQADITAYLAQEGIRPGVRKTELDAGRLALLLQRRYPEVAWFRVYVNNVTLTVECTQGVPAPPLPAAEPCDLTAARDGVVQTVEVYAGTAVVQPGDAVRSGQVIIRGEERGRDGETLPVAARGRVIAQCWTQTAVRVPVAEMQSRETGRSSTTRRLCTPWFSFPSEPESPDYLTSRLYLTDTPLAGCFFPIWLRTAEYREVELIPVPRPQEQVKEEAEAAALSLLREKLRGYRITGEWTETETGADGYLYATAHAGYMADLCLPKEGFRTPAALPE
ncbi:MAG: sporulation protein YqfD [Clostridia bacterium]|nr:sporulation protein YqfD [Clostridia bacterium]